MKNTAVKVLVGVGIILVLCCTGIIGYGIYQNANDKDSVTNVEEIIKENSGSADSETVADSTHVHTFNDKVVKEATCTEWGTIKKTCTGCGYETYEKLPPLGHSEGDWEDTGDGLQVRKCTICGAVLETKSAVNVNHVHSYAKVITVEATCLTDGEAVYTCSCGASYREVIPATGHNYVSTVTKAPTTVAMGVMTYTCSHCGVSYEQTIPKVAPTDTTVSGTTTVSTVGGGTTTASNHVHSYTGKVTKAATCSTEGIMTYTCSCGADYTQTIPMTTHTTDSGAITTAATCVSTGVKTYKCKVCGQILSTQTIPMIDHKYVLTKIIQPTSTEKGQRTYTCSACGETYTEFFTN